MLFQLFSFSRSRRRALLIAAWLLRIAHTRPGMRCDPDRTLTGHVPDILNWRVFRWRGVHDSSVRLAAK